MGLLETGPCDPQGGAVNGTGDLSNVHPDYSSPRLEIDSQTPFLRHKGEEL
jgi:hypothetical protein